jgi:hypothetical protein
MSVERSEEVMRRYIAEVISEQKLEVIDEISGRRAVRVATAGTAKGKRKRGFLTRLINPFNG